MGVRAVLGIASASASRIASRTAYFVAVLALMAGSALAEDPTVPPAPPGALCFPTVGILPEHCGVVVREVPGPTRMVRRPRTETVRVPVYAFELVDTYITIEQPIYERGEGLLQVPQRVPDVQYVDVPVYGEVAGDCPCDSATRRVVLGVERREQTCGWKLVWVTDPRKIRVPQVVARCVVRKVPTGKRMQWVRKGDKDEQRVVRDECGRVVYDEVAEPICGGRPTRIEEQVQVPCVAVTVIPDPSGPLSAEDMRLYRGKFARLPHTQDLLTRTEFEQRRAVIAAGGPVVVAPSSPRDPKQGHWTGGQLADPRTPTSAMGASGDSK